MQGSVEYGENNVAEWPFMDELIGNQSKQCP